mmetsp:Transcript_37326/g.78729  ORF Transcript_37326/g.78729 Transcript_37326/m.78729 type:complete len:205 (-) Transcript_37326:103-717(-)
MIEYYYFWCCSWKKKKKLSHHRRGHEADPLSDFDFSRVVSRFPFPRAAACWISSSMVPSKSAAEVESEEAIPQSADPTPRPQQPASVAYPSAVWAEAMERAAPLHLRNLHRMTWILRSLGWEGNDDDEHRCWPRYFRRVIGVHPRCCWLCALAIEDAEAVMDGRGLLPLPGLDPGAYPRRRRSMSFFLLTTLLTENSYREQQST